MARAQMALRYALIALVLYAPLLCLRFCETLEQMGLAHGDVQAQLAQWGRNHAHGGGLSLSAPHQGQSEGSHQAPLTRLREMVSAVTEFVAPIAFLFLLAAFAHPRRALLPAVTRILLDIPTPPPRSAIV